MTASQRDTEKPSSVPGPQAKSALGRRAIRGGVLGNYADQFDIFLPVIALAPVAVTLFGTGGAVSGVGWVFVATLFGRPLGAAIFGPLADRWGRAATTRIVLVGVAATTCAIAVTPDHMVLGQGTLVVVIALRFIGGVFLGGEYTSAVPLAMEWSAPRRRGHVSGMIMSMSPWANATIAAIVLLLLSGTGPIPYAAWGWRILFVTGAVIALSIRLYYQRGIHDPATSAGEDRPRHPLREVVGGAERKTLLQVFVLMSGLWLLTDMAIPVLTGTLKSVPALAPANITLVLLLATIVSAFGILVAGVISTRIGRRPFFVGFGLVAALGGPGVYLVITRLMGHAGTPGVMALAGVVALLQLVTVSGYGPVAAYLSERFPTRVRSTGYGLAYSASIVLPALYPYYLPLLQNTFGPTLPVVALLGLGGVLVAIGGAAGPETVHISALR